MSNFHEINDSQRKLLRDKIVEGSKKYKDKLMSKNIIIICEDETSHNVCFFANDFLHLTGICSDLNESNFFLNSYAKTLSEGNICSQQKYNWQTLKSKAERIQKIDEIIYTDVQASLFMTNLHTNTYTYPIAIRNKTQNTCVGFKDNMHKARTLRKETNSRDADSEQKIIAIFAKAQTQSLYDELIYISDMDNDFNKILKIKELLSKNILNQITKNIERQESEESAVTLEQSNNSKTNKDGQDSD